MRIRLSKPYFGDKQSLMDSIEDVLDRGFLVQGRYVSQFEEQVADFLGVRNGIAVSSGTAALHLSLIVLGIGPGDEVVVPAYTFPATANVVELVGAKPVLVDVDLETFNIDPDRMMEVISPKTKAIIPVHLFGNPAEMDRICKISKTYGLKVIEDAAGALGSKYKGRSCGSIGTLGCFSFHPRKIITTGEGGMVVTDDDGLAERIRSLRNHGARPRGSQYDFVLAGFNYRLNELEAALGVSQMDGIQMRIDERRRLAEHYMDLLKSIPGISFQKTLPGTMTTWQAFVIRSQKKDIHSILDWLQKMGIEANVGTYAIHLLRYYRGKYHYTPSNYPNAVRLYSTTMALPFYNRMPRKKVQQVVEALREVRDEN